jgi:hypothetical protein
VASFEQAFRTRLKSDPAVAAIVQNRIDWGDIPQAWGLPNVRLTLVSGGRDQHLKGFYSRQQSRVRLEARASTYAEMVELAKACEAASLGPTTIDNVVLGRAMVEAPRDAGDNPGTGFVHRRITDFLVPHNLV